MLRNTQSLWSLLLSAVSSKATLPLSLTPLSACHNLFLRLCRPCGLRDERLYSLASVGDTNTTHHTSAATGCAPYVNGIPLADMHLLNA
jgi:hypothetical protein